MISAAHLPPSIGLENLPACGEGRAMLKAFADRLPNLCVTQQSLIEPVTKERIQRNLLWRTFTNHWARCDKCNEACVLAGEGGENAPAV